jgi:hypothetical protein
MEFAMSSLHLRCKVTDGQFENEVAVSGLDYQGERFSMFVDRQFVEGVGAPGDHGADAMLLVTSIAEKDDLVLIRLPGETLSNGRTITVRRSQLETACLKN